MALRFLQCRTCWGEGVREGNRRFLAASIAIAIAGLVVVSTTGLARPPLMPPEWDVIFTYTLDDTGTPIDFDQTGTYDTTIDCSGTWSETSHTTWGTNDPNDYIEYAIDVVELQVGFAHQENGSVEKRVATCSDGLAVPLGLITDDYVIHEECLGDEDDDGTALDSTKPGVAPTQTRQKHDVRNPGDDDCTVAAAAAAGNGNGEIPFSGRVVGEFYNEDQDLVTRARIDVLGGRTMNRPQGVTGVACESGTPTTPGFCDIFAESGGFLGLTEFLSAGHFRAWTHVG